MDTLYVILYLLAAICFVVAAFFVSTASAATNNVVTRVNLVALGLLFAVLVPLIKTIDSM
jgi:hypothetical protein